MNTDAWARLSDSTSAYAEQIIAQIKIAKNREVENCCGVIFALKLRVDLFVEALGYWSGSTVLRASFNFLTSSALVIRGDFRVNKFDESTFSSMLQDA